MFMEGPKKVNKKKVALEEELIRIGIMRNMPKWAFSFNERLGFLAKMREVRRALAGFKED